MKTSSSLALKATDPVPILLEMSWLSRHINRCVCMLIGIDICCFLTHTRGSQILIYFYLTRNENRIITAESDVGGAVLLLMCWARSLKA